MRGQGILTWWIQCSRALVSVKMFRKVSWTPLVVYQALAQHLWVIVHAMQLEKWKKNSYVHLGRSSYAGIPHYRGVSGRCCEEGCTEANGDYIRGASVGRRWNNGARDRSASWSTQGRSMLTRRHHYHRYSCYGSRRSQVNFEYSKWLSLAVVYNLDF